MTFDPDKIALDEEEQWIEDNLEGFVPAPEWVGRSLHEAARATMDDMRSAKKQISINVDGKVIAYFKELAAETGVAYHRIINMFLVQCVNEKKRPVFA